MVNNVATTGFQPVNPLQNQKKEKDEELASGRKINSASDNAAGFQLANRLTSGINEANQRTLNAQDQVNANAVTETATAAVNDGLQRARELTIQASNPLVNQTAIQGELDQLTDQINTVAERSFGVSNFVPSLDASDPASTLETIDTALEQTGQQATALGAESNSLQSAINTYQVQATNLSASRSRIVDTDFAQAASEQQQINTQLQIALRVQKEEQERKGAIFDQFV